VFTVLYLTLKHIINSQVSRSSFMPLGKHSSLLLLLVVGLIFTTCRKDNLLTDMDAKLSFSLDTLTFDTVFTQIGSTTLSFKVFNKNNQRLRISVVKLAGGAASQFRMNVDGFATTLASDVEIAAKDSMHVFVEVTVDPGVIDLPFVIEDRILFLIFVREPCLRELFFTKYLVGHLHK